MSHPSTHGGFLPLLLALQAGSVSCTLTGADFNPGLASEPPACSGDACGAAGHEPGAAAEVPDRGAGDDSASSPQLPPEIIAGPIGIDGSDADPPSPATADAGPTLPGSITPRPSVVSGWASAPGLGLTTTSGGGAGERVVAETAEALLDFAARPEPLIITLRGSFEVPRLNVASNKTLVGAEGGATLRGGLRVRGSGADDFVSNVIVQNLEIDALSSDVEGDGVQIHYAHHIWIDHCTIRDAADGLIDIVHGSDFVTLSFNRLFYTEAAPAPDHRFANLIGHSVDNGAEDAGHLNVTLHHNFFGPGVLQASFVRFGRIHLFDNHFASPGNSSVVTAGLLSRVLLENNYFQGVVSPHALFPNSSASLLASGNVYDGTSGAQDATGAAFAPDYAYQLDAATEVPALVQALSGPR